MNDDAYDKEAGKGISGFLGNVAKAFKSGNKDKEPSGGNLFGGKGGKGGY
jgi:hypothetical protein